MKTANLKVEAKAAAKFNPHKHLNKVLRRHLAQDAYSARENAHYDPEMNKRIVKDSYDPLNVMMHNHVAFLSIVNLNNPEVTFNNLN